MTLMQEIALRQSIMFGGLILGLVLMIVYAITFSHRRMSWYKTLAACAPHVAFLFACLANFAAPVVSAAVALVLLREGALSRGRYRIGGATLTLATALYAMRFFQMGMPTAPVIMLGALFWIAAVMLQSAQYRAMTSDARPSALHAVGGALSLGASQVLLISAMGFANPLFSI